MKTLKICPNFCLLYSLLLLAKIFYRAEISSSFLWCNYETWCHTSDICIRTTHNVKYILKTQREEMGNSLMRNKLVKTFLCQKRYAEWICWWGLRDKLLRVTSRCFAALSFILGILKGTIRWILNIRALLHDIIVDLYLPIFLSSYQVLKRRYTVWIYAQPDFWLWKLNLGTTLRAKEAVRFPLFTCPTLK